jgi:hypothetical protein
LITKYAKVYALNAFNYLDNLSISTDLTAQLFNTDKVLRQISAKIISNIDEFKYLGFKKRLNDKLRVELDRLIEMNALTGRNIIDRLAYYRNVSNPENYNAPLFWLYQASVVYLSNTNLFDLGLFKNTTHVILVEQGDLMLYKENNLIKTFSPGDVFDTNEYNKTEYSIKSTDKTLIHFIDYKKFLAELYDNDYLTEYLTHDIVKK